MPKVPRAELVELFLQEVAGYIPEIQSGLEKLTEDRENQTELNELHRLYHNIKGASSQVQLPDLSQASRIIEQYLSRILEDKERISDQWLEITAEATNYISEFVDKNSSDPGDEKKLYSQIVELVSSYSEGRQEAAELLPGIEEDVKEEGEPQRELQKCIQDVRTTLPLMVELAECFSKDGKNENLDRGIYKRFSSAFSILATVVKDAGLDEQQRLMIDFSSLLKQFSEGIYGKNTELPGLVRDFLTFLQVIYITNPENTSAISNVRNIFQSFESSLEQLSHYSPPELILESDDSDLLFNEIDEQDESIVFLDELVDSELDLEESKEDIEDVDTKEQIEEGIDYTLSSPVLEVDAFDDGDDQLSDEQNLLMEIFQEECDEHLIVINQALNNLEGKVRKVQPLDSELRGVLSGMRRAVHTLKGAAAMSGVNLLSQGAHSLEDILDWIHDESGEIGPEEMKIVANGIDEIEFLSQKPDATESVGLDRLVATINEYLDTKRAGHVVEDRDGEVVQEAEDQDYDFTDPNREGQESVELVEETEEIEPVLPGEVGSLRVRLEDLDELVSIEGELVVTRGALEKMIEEMNLSLVELENVKENLRRKAQELESGFEVQSLYGFNPAAAGGRQSGEGTLLEDLTDFDPIELDRYSQLSLIIRSLNEITVDVSSIYSSLNSLSGEISGQVSKQQLTMRLMQDKLMRIRMTPMSSISRILFRTVRETANKLEKKVTLTITGEDVYMDRFVWAKITDPLMHILRNSVDHGIESNEKRVQAGKPENAQVEITTEQRSRYVMLQIRDDGAGIDLEKVRSKIEEDGLVEDAKSLSDDEVLEYIFHPSFTTRDEISSVSGRGVGLDVVRQNIQALRGSIQVKNSPGKGVIFELYIPFTLSVNRAAIVSVLGSVYAVPLQDIEQVRHFTPKEIVENEDSVTLLLGDQRIGVSNLGYYLQLEDEMVAKNILQSEQGGLLVILFEKGDGLHAVSIDSVIEQREIIVKNLGSHLTHVHGISGVTLTGTGEMIPILNLSELVELQEGRKSAADFSVKPEVRERPLKVLIVDDSISVRYSVARLIESKSWEQQQAIDGVDALTKLETFMPDIIILDIEMPRMNGYEFKSSLNTREKFKDIPVVMLTSRVSAKHQQKARDLGIAHYMTKPYQEDTFTHLLEEIRAGLN